MKFSETDIKLMQLLQRRNLSKLRIKQYNLVFREIYELVGKTPSELIAEAKKEEQPFNDENGNPKILDLSERQVNIYQFKYNKFLEDKNNCERTKKSKMWVFRALFNEYNIEMPRMLKYNPPVGRTRIRDIPSWDDVRKSLNFCESNRDKALICFIATSGMRGGDVLKLTIQDFLDATSIYNNGSLEDLLSKNPYDIVPCYDFFPSKTKREGNLCITFNTGECTYFIFEHLKERIEKGYSVKPDDSLFRSRDRPHFLSIDVLRKTFQKLNNQLELGKDKNGLYSKFRAHNLRKLFSSTCRRNITNVVVKADKYSELDVVSIFTGHVPPNMNNSEVYDAVDSEDSFDSYLRKNYEALIPYLTINKKENIVKKDNGSLENEIFKIKESVDILLSNKDQLSLKS